MTTWLSRIMAVVFTFTVLAPTDLLAQKAPVKRKNTSTGTLTRKVQKAVEETREQYLERLQEEYANAKDVFALTKVLYEMHNPSSKHAVTFDPAQLQADLDEISKAPPKYLPDTTAINPDYQAYMLGKKIKENQKNRQEADEMINRITNAEESWENLMLYLDPILGQPDNLISSVVVAEILGNTLDSNQPEIIAEMDLLELQLRAIFRLRGLENQPKNTKPQDMTERVVSGTDNNLQKIQAIGTLRMLLLKVNQYYQRTGKENPLFERRNQSNVVYQRVDTGKDSNPAWTIKGNQSTVHQLFFPEMYDKMMADFLQSIQQIKEKNPKENSAEYQNMVLWTEFAVSFAMLHRPQKLTTLVNIFDEGAKSTKFLQPSTTILGVIFRVIRENLQFSPLNDNGSFVFSMLPNFTDPERYSLPTRIFALEAASILYKQYNQQTEQERMEQWGLVQKNNNLLGGWYQTFEPNLKTQLLMAARTVDIYDSLTRYRYETYGLDANQMKELSDKLAFIYDGFANADLKFEHPDSDPVRYSDITQTKGGLCTIKNAGNEIPRLRQPNSPFMLEAFKYNGNGFGAGDLKLRTFYGAGRKSNGEWIEMNFDNGKNPEKVKDDMDRAVLTFAAEAILWVYGGELLSLFGRAFRVARGATLALPKATRAAVNANKGRRMLAFSIEVKKGVRFASLHKTTVANGVSVAATRVETVTKSVPVASKGKEVAALTKGLDVPPSPLGASSVPLLTGSKLSKPRSWWHNMRRKWTGVEYKYTVEEPVTEAVASMRGFKNQTLFGAARSPVKEWTIMSHRPGFDFQAATLSGAKAERLSGGIHSWDDWRYLMRNARTEQGLRLSVATDPLKPFSSWWSSNFTPLFGARTASSQIYNENRVIGATARAFEKDAVKEAGRGAFDYWKYTDSGWVRINQKEFMKLGDAMSEAAKEVVPDYYAFLGIGRSASQAEIKAAYKQAAIKFHPDRFGGSHELFIQAQQALKALETPAARAAYDAKLAKAAKNVVRTKLPKSPEGISLAVTSPVGQNVPKGFSPMTKSAKGFGFHEGNWGAVPEQLAVHLSRTGQTEVLGAPYMFSNRWVGGLASNTVFFGGLNITDQALGGSFQNYITGNAAKEVEKAQKKFGDAYDPDLLKKDEEAMDETLAILKEQGFTVPASSVLDDVSAAAEPSAIGSTLSFPLIAAWNGLSKTQLGSFVGIKTPFMDTGTMARLGIGANRLQVNRLVRKYNEAKDTKSVDQFYKDIMTIWDSFSANFESSFAQLDMVAGAGTFAREKQEMSALLASSKKEFERIYNGNGELADKYTQLDATAIKFIQKYQQLDQALAQKWQFQNMITTVEVDWNNDLTSLVEEVPDESQRAVWSEQINQVYKTALSELRALYKQGVSFEDPRVIGCYQKMQLQLIGIVPQQEQAQSAEDDTKDYVFAEMMWEIDQMEVKAKKHNIDLSGFINDWRVGMEEIYRSAKNVTEMQMKMIDLSAQIHKKYENDEAYRLFKQKYDASAGSVEEEEYQSELLPDETAGNINPEEDKSELFPDETTETPSSLY